MWDQVLNRKHSPFGSILHLFVCALLVIGLCLPAICGARGNSAIVGEIMDTIDNRFRQSRLYQQYMHPGYNVSEHGFIADPKKARVMTLVTADVMLKILDDKEIKNQHQTGDTQTGSYSYDPEARYRIEENLAGIALKKRVRDPERLKQILPKYGLIEFPDFAMDPSALNIFLEDIKLDDELDVYGEIAIYFKPAIKRRTSFVPKDSGQLGVPSKVGEWVQSMNAKQIIIDASQVEKGRIFEGEIWGELAVREIDYVVLPRRLFFDSSGVRLATVQRRLKEEGIPALRKRDPQTPFEEAMDIMRVRFHQKMKRLQTPSSCKGLLGRVE